MTSGGGVEGPTECDNRSKKEKRKKEGKVKFLEMKREEVKIERKW